MKLKDQIVLEELYEKILLDSTMIEENIGGVNINKVVHDAMNNIMEYLFELDPESYKKAVSLIIKRLNYSLQQMR